MSTTIQYVEESEKSGYGVALMNASGTILSPYVDLCDYPDLMDLECHEYCGSCVVSVPSETYIFILHSGILEERYNLQQKNKDLHPIAD